MGSEAISEVTDYTTDVTKGINYALIMVRITYFQNTQMADSRIPPENT